MLTAAETARLSRIKQAALRGDAKLVSRADKQWVLDIAAREGSYVPAPAAAMALREGYNVSHVNTIGKQTVAM